MQLEGPNTVSPKGTVSLSPKRPKTNIALPPDCRLRLPPELMSLVFRNLPTESIVSLAITCRVFYLKYFHQNTPIPGPHEEAGTRRKIRENFLGWLEKDIPELAYCHYCDRLHPWRAVVKPGRSKDTPSSFTHQDYCKTDPSRPGRYRSHGPYDLGPWPTFPLSFYTAHLAMNAVRYGPDHGPSLDSLKVHRKVTDIMHKVSETVRWELKVIDDELYVYGQSVLRHIQGSAAELYQYLRENQQRLTCRHMAINPLVAKFTGQRKLPPRNHHSLFEDMLFPGLPSNTGHRGPISIFPIGQHPVRSCDSCWTDFQIEIREATVPLDPSERRLLPIVLRRREGGDPTLDLRAYEEHLLCQDPRDYIITISQWVRLGPCKNLELEPTWKSRLGESHRGTLFAYSSDPNSTPKSLAGNVMFRWYGIPDDRSAAEAVVRGGWHEDEDDDQPLALWAILRPGPPRYVLGRGHTQTTPKRARKRRQRA